MLFLIHYSIFPNWQGGDIASLSSLTLEPDAPRWLNILRHRAAHSRAVCVWGSQPASGPGRGATFFGLALDHKFIFTYQEQEHCSQLFTEPELPLDTKSRINDNQSHIFCFWGQCKQRYFAFATTKFCCLQRIPCISSNTHCSFLFLLPILCLMFLLTFPHHIPEKKSRNKAYPYQSLAPWRQVRHVFLVFWGHAWRKTQTDRSYIWFNLDAPVKFRATSDVKHLLRHCVLEG